MSEGSSSNDLLVEDENAKQTEASLPPTKRKPMIEKGTVSRFWVSNKRTRQKVSLDRDLESRFLQTITSCS